MSRPRLVLLGLDGLPLDLARQLSPNLPNLARIAENAGIVNAEIPELSPVNWTSLATASGPEDHGIYGFTKLDPASYQLSVVSSLDTARPTIFDHLGQAGLVSRVVNLPNTWPARPLRGMLIAGFVAWDLERAVHPPFLASKLAGYKLEADTSRAASDPDQLLAECSATLDSRRMALDLLWPDLTWDLFVFVLTETDRILHFLFPAVADPDHPRHPGCLALLTKWDRLLGEVLERFDALPEPKRLVVTADHGFAELITEVDLNAWLMERGLLSLAGTPRDEWDASVIGPGSAAFALDPGRIYLHRADRFARGPLTPDQARDLLPAIRQGLADLTFEGRPVMQEVLTSEQAYGPDARGQVPDLICVPRPGFDCKAKFDRDAVFGRFGRTGAHTRAGGLFFDSNGEHPARLRDVGRLVLTHFDASISD